MTLNDNSLDGVCLGLEPLAAGWKVQINLLSYGGRQV